MPVAASLLGTGLVSSTFYPYSITIDGLEVAPTNASLESLDFEESGDDVPGELHALLWDPTLSVAVREQSVVRVVDNNAGATVYTGLVITRRTDRQAVGRWIEIWAAAVSTMLDELLVPNESRPTGESDAARVAFLWQRYARWPLSMSMSQVQQTNATMSADLLVGLTLRSALDQTASLAGGTTRWYIDSIGRLVWRAGNGVTAAPYAINVTPSPPGGSIRPETLTVTRDGILKNRYLVRGANAAGTAWVQDDASVLQYGPREDYIDAPSADTLSKAQTIGQLALGKTAAPNIRAVFTTDDLAGSGWRADQNVTITSAADDLNAEVLRIASVQTRFLRGDGLRHYTIRAGKTGARLSGIPAASTFVPPKLGAPAFVLRGRMTITDEKGNEVGYLTARDAGDTIQLWVPGAGNIDFGYGLTDGALRLTPGDFGTGAPSTSTAGTQVQISGPFGFLRHSYALSAASDQIPSEDRNETAVVLELVPSANITLTSTPTIPDPPWSALVSQLMVLINRSSSFTVTLQNETALAGSNLRLGAASRTLGYRDVLVLLWSPGTDDWLEVMFSNNL